MRHPHAALDAHLELLVARSIERYRPTRVAIGVAGRDRCDHELGRWVAKVARHLRIECVFVDVPAAADALIARSSGCGFDRLPQRIAAQIPELMSYVLAEKGTSADFNLRRRRSYAWKAALTALAGAGAPALAHTVFDSQTL
jgi:hypothetical protein